MVFFQCGNAVKRSCAMWHSYDNETKWYTGYPKIEVISYEELCESKIKLTKPNAIKILRIASIYLMQRMKSNNKRTVLRNKTRAISNKVFYPIHATVPTRLVSDFRGPNGEMTTVAIGWHIDGETGAFADHQRSS